MVSLLIVAAVGFGIRIGLEESGGKTDPPEPVAGPTIVPGKAPATSPETTPALWRTTEPAPSSPLPNISGRWQWTDGTIYVMTQYENGTFGVESTGLGSGQARFIAKMPGKFEIEMFGIGRGEFAVSNSEGKAMGWFILDNNSQQDFGSLVQIE